jgi:hypothetical protein
MSRQLEVLSFRLKLAAGAFHVYSYREDCPDLSRESAEIFVDKEQRLIFSNEALGEDDSRNLFLRHRAAEVMNAELLEVFLPFFQHIARRMASNVKAAQLWGSRVLLTSEVATARACANAVAWCLPAFFAEFSVSQVSGVNIIPCDYLVQRASVLGVIAELSSVSSQDQKVAREKLSLEVESLRSVAPDMGRAVRFCIR